MNFQAKTKHLKDLHIKFVGNVIIEKTYRKRVKIYQKYQKLRSIEPWWKYIRIQTVFLFPINWFTGEKYQNWITNFVKRTFQLLYGYILHMCICVLIIFCGLMIMFLHFELMLSNVYQCQVPEPFLQSPKIHTKGMNFANCLNWSFF